MSALRQVVRALVGPRARAAIRNLLANAQFAGAIAGTPGASPTSWTLGFAGGTLAVAGSTLTTSTAVAARQFVQSGSVSLPPSSTYTFALDVGAVSVAGAAEAIAVLNVTAGAVSGTTSILSSAGVGRQSMTFTTGAAGATLQVRVGAGVAANTVGATSVTFSKPMLESGSIAHGYVAT